MRLVATRLFDMSKMHPQQDSSRVCALCSAPVGIYPSGQAALHANPTMEIVCSVCATKNFNFKLDHAIPAAAPEVIVQEVKDSYAVKKA
jgi:hypothetical protein